MSAPFCSICTDVTGLLVRRPLGKDGALVSVCMACDHGDLRSGRWHFDGGEEPEPGRNGVGEGNRHRTAISGGGSGRARAR